MTNKIKIYKNDLDLTYNKIISDKYTLHDYEHFIYLLECIDDTKSINGILFSCNIENLTDLIEERNKGSTRNIKLHLARIKGIYDAINDYLYYL